MKLKQNRLLTGLVVSQLSIGLTSVSTLSAQQEEEVKDKASSHKFPRAFGNTHRKAPEQHQRPEMMLDQYRSIDGYGNNRAIPEWGSAERAFMRIFPAAYADGVSSPSGPNRKSARAISNALAFQNESILNSKGASDFLWQWGQFLDHDITETPTHDPAEALDITVPTGDPSFDPESTGQQVIPMSRSFYEEESGVREQVNVITAFIDASNVYGSDIERANALRTLDGTGRLKVTVTENHGDLLPFNEDGIDNAGGTSDQLFIAGDVRVNEQVGLTAMHTLFMREHNYWAEKIQTEHPGLSGDEVYQRARTIVAAEMQAITYNEFLPVLLGHRGIPEYRGYQPRVRPDISNSFATAGYRFGHSLLSPLLLRLDAYGAEIPAGHLSLAEAFFRPSHTTEEGIEVTLRGLAAQQCQELDEQIISEVRDFLFGAPGAGGLDLAALNIQRGRDHGLPDYNTVRELLGRLPARQFTDITSDPDTVQRLSEAYTDINDMDLWIVGLAEDPVADSMLGPVLNSILVDQFRRLRDGDSFFYKHALPEHMVKMIDQQTLATIIRRNTTIDTEIQDNVFLVKDAIVTTPNSGEVNREEVTDADKKSPHEHGNQQKDKRRKSHR